MPLNEPLRFEPIALPKVWGDSALAPLAGCAPMGADPVGEVWQVSDRDGFTSVVAEGAFAGRNLCGLMLSEREALLGRSATSSEGGFPLLVKLLAAAKPLSVLHDRDVVADHRLEAPAEQVAVELLGSLEILGDQIDPDDLARNLDVGRIRGDRGVRFPVTRATGRDEERHGEPHDCHRQSHLGFLHGIEDELRV